MAYILGGIAALAALIGLGYVVIRTDPKVLAKVMRYLGGLLLIAAGLVFSFGGRAAIGVPAIGIGLIALLRGRVGPIGGTGGAPATGQRSTVRSRYIEAELDHDSGAVTGTVRQGAFAGIKLDDLDERMLRELRAEAAGDADSVALIEAYLDRRMPGWREDGQADGGAGAGGPADAGGMTDEEAYEILGLAPGATDAEIRAAHHRLMQGVHPDRGGSTFLAARVNQAKDWLLGKHR